MRALEIGDISTKDLNNKIWK